MKAGALPHSPHPHPRGLKLLHNAGALGEAWGCWEGGGSFYKNSGGCPGIGDISQAPALFSPLSFILNSLNELTLQSPVCFPFSNLACILLSLHGSGLETNDFFRAAPSAVLGPTLVLRAHCRAWPTSVPNKNDGRLTEMTKVGRTQFLTGERL